MNWPYLIEDVRMEVNLLRQLLKEADGLIQAVQAAQSTATDHLAAGSVLQSFYNGVEKIFALVADEVDGGWEKGENPRRSLLIAISRPSLKRDAVVEGDLADQFHRYLEFREAFRYAHFYQLTWEETTPLIVDLAKMLAVFEAQLDAFFTKASGQKAGLTKNAEAMPRYWTQPVKIAQPRMPLRPLIGSCLVAMVVGLFAGSLAMRSHTPAKSERFAAKKIARYIEAATFTSPDGKQHKISQFDPTKDFVVTVGGVFKAPDDKLVFTGAVSQDSKSIEGWPMVSLSFIDGKAMAFQAVTADGEVRRGLFRNNKLVRQTQCDQAGQVYRVYHLAEDGQVSCIVERGQRAGGQSQATDGWYYTFYEAGREVHRLFVTDSGRTMTLTAGGG